MGCGASVPDGGDRAQAQAAQENANVDVSGRGLTGGGHSSDFGIRTSSIHRVLQGVPWQKKSIKGDEDLDGSIRSFRDGAPSLTDMRPNSAGLEEDLHFVDEMSEKFASVLLSHARFLVNYAAVMEFHSMSNKEDLASAPPLLDVVQKPKLVSRQFKSHTMDNVRVRKMCDELLHLEDPDHVAASSSGAGGSMWMRTLQISVGKNVSALKMSNNPEVSIGGYFIISQTLSYTRGLLSLDLSGNSLTAAEARVLSLGLRSNKSVQDLCLKDNQIGSEGATNIADMLKVNHHLMLLDLRTNKIRGNGICILADAMSDNSCLTQLDVRWNYAGEVSDFVVQALSDLKSFCRRNMNIALESFKNIPEDGDESASPKGKAGVNLSGSSANDTLGDVPVFEQSSIPPVIDEWASFHHGADNEFVPAGSNRRTLRPAGEDDDEVDKQGVAVDQKLQKRMSAVSQSSSDISGHKGLNRRSSQESNGHALPRAGFRSSNDLGRASEGVVKLTASRNVRSGSAVSAASIHSILTQGSGNLQTGANLGVSEITAIPEKVVGTMEVTLLRAENLPQVIWRTGKDGQFLGLPQAYCVFDLNKQTTQTMICKRDWNPVWDYTFSIDVREIWQVCTIKVKHSKSLSRFHIDDYNIGVSTLPVGQIVNWRGISLGLDGGWRAFHRPDNAPLGTTYTVCSGRTRTGEISDKFETAEEAAAAYDDQAQRKDREFALLNFAGDGDVIGAHVKEDSYPLTGEDGIEVVGIQAGVSSTVRCQLKYFMRGESYLEVSLEKAMNLPKMDAGLGSCDAYCVAALGNFTFKSRLVRNSLDPRFNQTFRIILESPDQALNLRFAIWDWDRFDEDDHMGDCFLSITPSQCASGARDGAYPITVPNHAFPPPSTAPSHTPKAVWNNTQQQPPADKAKQLQNAKGIKSELRLAFRYYPVDATKAA